MRQTGVHILFLSHDCMHSCVPSADHTGGNDATQVTVA